MELRECPFCGHAKPIIQARELIRREWSVFCIDGCGARGGWKWTPEEAVAAWNTRAVPPLAEMLREATNISLSPTLEIWRIPEGYKASISNGTHCATGPTPAAAIEALWREVCGPKEGE